MATAKVLIKGEDKLKQPLNQSKQELNSFASYAQQIGKKIESALSVASIIVALKKLADGIKVCVNEYAEAEKSALRLQKVWENVGEATGKSYNEIEKYSEALEKNTYFTKEAAEQSALLLAATESLSGEGFERALDASADLAAALGEDMTSAASTLAKALEDPASALTRLKTIGVTFTEEEKNQIKELTEANKLYEAQSIILDKVESKYKDVAKAINDTPAGTLDNIRDVLSDIRKDLGEGLLDAISPALETLYGWLVKISQWVSDAVNANSISQRLKEGESLSAFSTIELEKALKLYQDLIANPVNNEVKAHLDYYERWVATLQDELKARADAAKTVMPTFVNGGDNNVSSTKSSSETSTLASFLDSYGNTSTSYLKASYQALIDQATSFMDIINKGSFLDEDGSIQAVSQLGLPEGTTISDLRELYTQLSEVIAAYTDKLAKLDEEPEKKDEENPFEKALSQYGSLSKAFQIDEIKSEINRLSYLRVEADDVTGHYLDEIIAELFKQKEALEGIEDEIPETTKTFIESLTGSFGDYLSKTFNLTDEQGGAAAGALIGTAVSNMGEAGEVAGRLAQNMATMGPMIGAIVTALQYVIEGFAEIIGPELEEFVQYGLEPLREIGRVIADILLPIFEDLGPLVEESANFLIGLFDAIGAVLKPIVSFISSTLTPILDGLVAILNIMEVPLKLVAKGLSAVGETLGWLGDWIRHIIATVVNWIASIIPWMDGMEDPGKPGPLDERIEASWEKIDRAFNGDSLGTSTSTETAIKNASYSGATSVTINIYQEAPVVGDGGMLQFAQMIRDQFENLAYYSV